ncbi:enoyl-CoA hydratase/isomerase family protein [Planctobacterium marinum]|uniref:enoyl-CoA hydratase/isomerase family protein n=1 Tax=Planctobacterium marinum TaxID=1631968 RepID=UPI001E428C50|nr:enoyl-CoA hydratase/isomerase family protein [Planctobacterium marinum]MCC2604274.1 enoyl-CoA hydratase/isomerase family protein [Planctobacterium marinum]
MTDSVLYNLDERGVATVTLNRPEKHNAFDDALIAELTHLFKQIGEDKNVRAMVLQANGQSFCAGADAGWMKRMADYSFDENVADAKKLADMLWHLNYMPKPTIARVQGATYGGAVGLVACCDMAVASKLSKFCLSEVRLGLIPATISPYVIAAMGERVARRYFMTAEVFSARRARRLGLVSETVTEEELDTTIEDLLNNILRNGPQAVAAAKQLIFDIKNQPGEEEVIEKTCLRIATVRVSDEGQEGLSAFLEKRKPNWRKD